MTTTEPFRGALTRRPATARDPFPSLRRTTSTKPNLALPAAASTAQAGPRARRAYRLRSLPRRRRSGPWTPLARSRSSTSRDQARLQGTSLRIRLVFSMITGVTRAVNRLRSRRGQGSDHGHTSDRRRDPDRSWRPSRASPAQADPGQGSFGRRSCALLSPARSLGKRSSRCPPGPSLPRTFMALRTESISRARARRATSAWPDA